MGKEDMRDEDTIGRLQREVENHPEAAANWMRYGRALLSHGLLHESLDALTEAYRRDPDSLRVRYHLACALAQNGRHKEAIGHFWSVCLEDPTLEDADSILGLRAVLGIARACGESGDWKRAFRVLVPAATIAEEIMCTLAYISQQEGEHQRAAYLFSVGALIAPQNADAFRGAGYNKRKTGDLEGSRGDLERAVKLQPEDPALWYELGLTLAMMRKGAEARPVFEKVLSLEADHAWARYDIACLDALEGKREDAFANLNKAIDCGFRNLAHLEKDEDFTSVRQDPRWKQVLQRIPKKADQPNRSCLLFQGQGSRTVQ